MLLSSKVFKKGPSVDRSNYRPISQTNVFCKLMEMIISADILEYLNRHKLLHENQYGFIPKRSTLTNLLDFVNEWTFDLKIKFLVILFILNNCKKLFSL